MHGKWHICVNMIPIIMSLQEGNDSMLHDPNKLCAKIDYIKPIKIRKK